MSNKLKFTPEEADLIGRTADALSAYMGKPVLAEIVTEDPEFEWALFAIPLQPEEDDGVFVQVGGHKSKILGNAGGLDLSDGKPIDCELLWAIQLTNQENIRFIKVDTTGEEVAWTETILEMLPFDLQEPQLPSEDESDDDESELA